MRRLLLIPCCARKERSPIEIFEKEVKISDFIDKSVRSLKEGRDACKKDIDKNSEFVSALSRYSGNLYNEELKELIKVGLGLNFHLLIISASYGILRPEERIQHYNKQMSVNYSIWRDRVPTILEEYIINNKIEEVYGFFGSSTAYYKVVERCNWVLLKQKGLKGAILISPLKDAYSPLVASNGVPKVSGELIKSLIESDFKIQIDSSRFEVNRFS